MSDDHELSDAGTLSQSIGAIVRRTRQARVSSGLSWSESSALINAIAVGGATSADLARMEGISPQSMGTILTALEHKGYVMRAPDPGDGRRMLVSVTPAGAEHYRRRKNVRTEQMARVLAAEFNEAEVAQLVAVAPLLDRLADRLLIDAHSAHEEIPV